MNKYANGLFLFLSGDIQAYINSEVLEQFPEELQSGCVVFLKKVGVLKSGQGRGIYLLITPNNVALIYPPNIGKVYLFPLIFQLVLMILNNTLLINE